MVEPKKKEGRVKLEPLTRRDRDAKVRKGGPARKKNITRVSTALTKAFKDALTITPQQVAAYVPDTVSIQLCEAIVAGSVSSIEAMVAYTNLPKADIRAVMNDPVAVRWISLQVSEHIQHRLGLVDAAMYSRALAGDPTAAKIIYERFGKLKAAGGGSVTVHGNINISQLPDDDLLALIKDKEAQLKMDKVIDVEIEDNGREEPESGGAEAGRPEGAPAPPS